MHRHTDVLHRARQHVVGLPKGPHHVDTYNAWVYSARNGSNICKPDSQSGEPHRDLACQFVVSQRRRHCLIQHDVTGRFAHSTAQEPVKTTRYKLCVGLARTAKQGTSPIAPSSVCLAVCLTSDLLCRCACAPAVSACAQLPMCEAGALMDGSTLRQLRAGCE